MCVFIDALANPFCTLPVIIQRHVARVEGDIGTTINNCEIQSRKWGVVYANKYTKEECEAEFDRPFSGEGVRIIKSHVFAHHIDFLKDNWPDCPIVLVHRDNDACLGWWVRCGHFDITYPLYHKYYVNLKEMSKIIDDQNKDIVNAWKRYGGISPRNNRDLADILKINQPSEEYEQDYNLKDIGVKVI